MCVNAGAAARSEANSTGRCDGLSSTLHARSCEAAAARRTRCPVAVTCRAYRPFGTPSPYAPICPTPWALAETVDAMSGKVIQAAFGQPTRDRKKDRRTQERQPPHVAAISASIVIGFFPSCRCGMRRGFARGRTPDSQDGRDGRIRTDDPLPPRQMRYQAALRPDVLRVPPLRAGGKYNGGTSPRPPRRRAELSAAAAAGLLPAPSAPGG